MMRPVECGPVLHGSERIRGIPTPAFRTRRLGVLVGCELSAGGDPFGLSVMRCRHANHVCGRG